MSTIKVEKPLWARYLTQLNKSLQGKPALIEVAASSLGDQVLARDLPLTGISYDRKDDIIVVEVGDLEHVIRQPSRLEAIEDNGAVRSIEVVDAEGVSHIMQLKDPVLLVKMA